MAEKLGIFVSSDKHLDHLIGISRAAKEAGKEVIVFLTNRGVLLTQDPRFAEMEGLAEVSLCNVNFEAFGLKKPVPVHIVYHTVFLGPDGRIHYRRDIYKRDARLWQELEKKGVTVAPLQG